MIIKFRNEKEAEFVKSMVDAHGKSSLEIHFDEDDRDGLKYVVTCSERSDSQVASLMIGFCGGLMSSGNPGLYKLESCEPL